MIDGYMPLEAKKFKALNDNILVDWEEKQGGIKLGNSVLVRPATHTKQHYTGVVLDKGPDVSSEINVGDRIFFEQFSGFEKFYDEEYGRLAILKESSALAIVPMRVDISTDSMDYNYDR